MMQLTLEQQSVARAHPTSRQLVTAGPGTGKTQTLLARLQFLVDEAEISPADEILVLSFSRAAVRAVRERLRSTQHDQETVVRRVRVQTFDSFATALLAEIQPDGEWTSQSYEKRIEAATRLLREDEQARRHLSELRHICVDELQDLVGERAELVQAILEATPRAGFTLWGDPAQGIYTFGLENPELRKLGAWVLYGWLNRHFGETIETRELTINHRAQSPASRQLAVQMKPIGALLNQPSPDFEKVKTQLENVLLGAPCDGDFNAPAIQAALRASNDETRKTAILCRNNGEALMLSRFLWEKNIAHHYRRGATERALPAWIANVLGDFQADRIGKDSFCERCEERHPELDGEESFRALFRLAPAMGKTLDLELLARRVREGNLPDELSEQGYATLLISTVHRAKGLEFARVYVLGHEIIETTSDNWEEELRVWYVALTRPRSSLSRLKPINAHYRLIKNENTERWLRTFYDKKIRYRETDIEVRGSDSHWLDPAGAWNFAVCARETQNYIRQNVQVGDEVELRLHESRAEDNSRRAHYAIFHRDAFVGITGDDFGRDLRLCLTRTPNWNFHFPHRLQKLRVDAVDTVAGRPDTGRKHGLGERNLWLRVRVAGLGAFGWEKSE